jgi:hypothetical protein
MSDFLWQVRIPIVIYNSCGRMPARQRNSLERRILRSQGSSALLGLKLPESSAHLRLHQSH